MISDGWSGYCGLPDHDHQPKVVGATPAHLVLTWIHRVFSNLKRWALGTFHGLRRAHLRRYLDEFVFRWNRRRHTATAFDTLLGIGTRLRPADYRDTSDNTSDPGRPGASHRPPSDPPQSEPYTGPPACLTAHGRYLDEFVFRWNRRRHIGLLRLSTRVVPEARERAWPDGRRYELFVAVLELCDPPTTATSSDNTSDPGRPGASHRPPSDPPQSEPNTGPPACLTALETNFLKSKSSRTSPGTVRKPCLERRSPINIWCDRKQRDKP